MPDGRPRAALHGLGARQQRRGRRAGRVGLRPRQLLLARPDVRLRAVGRPGGTRARHGRLRRDQRGRTAGRAALLLAGAPVRVGGVHARARARSCCPRARATGTCSPRPTTSRRARRPGSSETGTGRLVVPDAHAGQDARAAVLREQGGAQPRGRLAAERRYRFTWFDPRAGEWRESVELRSDDAGTMQLPPFPGGQDVADTDWAAKIVTR